MRILVIGLDCATPELLFEQADLKNIRRLMAYGSWGRLESVIPPITVPAWMCMSTSQDPGTLGVYGFRNRRDYSYTDLQVVTSASITAPAIWDCFTQAGMNSVVVGVPPNYPPRKVSGGSVGCFLTPDTETCEYTWPRSLKQELHALLEGAYPVDVKKFRTDQKDWLREQIFEMTKKHFAAVRYLLTSRDWDYFQLVEIGLDRVHHGFWKHFDPAHRQHTPGNPYETVIPDYCRLLDEEIGKTLELVSDDTLVVVVSDHGAQRLDGGFCVNEWLRRERLLVLKEQPSRPTPFSPSMVDWERTRVWSEGGYYARVFFNVKGREPQGVISPGEYESFLEEMRQRLEALPDDAGRPMGTLVFRPREIYEYVNNVAPDLIVHFGGLFWRSIGSVGYDTLHLQENDTGPDDCNHAQYGCFILSGAGAPVLGRVEGMRLLDIAPTLISLAGEPVPSPMSGRTLDSIVNAGTAAGR